SSAATQPALRRPRCTWSPRHQCWAPRSSAWTASAGRTAPGSGYAPISLPATNYPQRPPDSATLTPTPASRTTRTPDTQPQRVTPRPANSLVVLGRRWPILICSMPFGGPGATAGHGQGSYAFPYSPSDRKLVLVEQVLDLVGGDSAADPRVELVEVG